MIRFSASQVFHSKKVQTLLRPKKMFKANPAPRGVGQNNLDFLKKLLTEVGFIFLTHKWKNQWNSVFLALFLDPKNSPLCYDKKFYYLWPSVYTSSHFKNTSRNNSEIFLTGYFFHTPSEFPHLYTQDSDTLMTAVTPLSRPPNHCFIRQMGGGRSIEIILCSQFPPCS